MEIYLDANATTPVIAPARAAALAAMAGDFGNPSSIHGTGLKARALLDGVRACARRVLGAASGQLLFVSGATEGLQMAVLSALNALRTRREAGQAVPPLLLYGATEHKAVPEALKHWNTLLGLNLQVLAIPVGRDGRHDLAWLRAHAPRAGLVCTMAANNETGVISDLHGIAAALTGSAALWLVDGVQALGKLPLRLDELPIAYAAFSGHKLYAPKGIGLLYVRAGAPVTPLMAGGGQEGALRSGTENMPGIAALGAVLAALEDGRTFAPHDTLADYRERLAVALRAAFPGLVFNAPPAICLPTTLNFSVPHVSAKLLLDVFDAAQLRVSGGSACSAARALPSDVLTAMGLPAWQAASAVRLSFGPATDAASIAEACARIQACGESLRDSGLLPRPAHAPPAATPLRRLTRFVADGACCYVLADAESRRGIVIDPQPALTAQLAGWLHGHGVALAAVLHTRSGADPAATAAAWQAARPAPLQDTGAIDAHGWPLGAARIALGRQHLTRLPTLLATGDAAAYVLHDASGPQLAFIGELPPGGPALQHAVHPRTLLLPARDTGDRLASTLHAETAASAEPAPELTPAAVVALLRSHPGLLLVDVREPFEQRLGHAPALDVPVQHQAVPMSALLDALPGWLALPEGTPVLFFCRSGNRSAQAARVLRRLGHAPAWSLTGGLALWPAQALSTTLEGSEMAV